MNGTAIFALAMPALTLAFIVWMIAAGYSKTDWNPKAEPPNPYPERIDTFGRWFLGLFTAALYIGAAVTIGPLAAAIGMAALLAFDAVCVFVFTTVQELIFALKGPKVRETEEIVSRAPYLTRLFRNFRDFYVNLIAYAF